MKKMLFISNVSNEISNFSIPSIYAGQSFGYEVHLAANYSKFNDDASIYNVKIHNVDIDRNPFNFIKNIKAYKQMLALIEKEHFDVIHCNTPIGGILGRICGKRAKVSKVIYSAHGFHFYKGAPLLNNTFYKWIELWLAHFTDAIITINKEDYQAAKKFKLRNNGGVYYIHGVGVDTSNIKDISSKRKELIQAIGADYDSVLMISIGELNENKNNKVIIKALGKLQNSKIHYLLCGIGNKKDALINISKKYNLENNIHFLGYRSDVFQLLKSCDIFAMPSHREGLSRSLMEAMSAEIPCIVSNIRGNVDLIENGKGGYLCGMDDCGDFLNVISVLATNNELRKEMGKFNLEKIKQFDINNVITEMKEIYGCVFR